MNIGAIVGSIASGTSRVIKGQDQQKEGAALRKSAKFIQKEKLRPEFERKLRATEMAALQGLPGKDAYVDALEQQSATAIENIKRASPNAASTLAAISASLADERQRKQQLQAMEAKGRVEGELRAANVLGEIGQEERKLEQEQTRRKENVFAAADQFEKAGTANIQRGMDMFGSATTMAAGMGSGGFGGGGNTTPTTTDPQVTDPSGGGGTSQVIQATPSGGGGGSANPSNMAASNAIGSNPSVGLFSVQGGGTFPMNTSSGFDVLPETDKIAFAKSKNLLAPQATDADYQQLLKDPSVIKMLGESYGK